MNLSQRQTHVVVDSLGMDPLRDKSFEAIQSITDYSRYTVSDTDAYNAPLIAHKMYENKDLWWVILIYNGMPDAFRLSSGTQIRVPAINNVITALSDIQDRSIPNRFAEI